MPDALRNILMVMMVGLCAFASAAQDEVKKKGPTRRFGFDVDEVTYPQKGPAETMKSIITAYDRKRLDYLLAHIADPAYVDYWVERYKDDFAKGKDEGKRLLAFERLARETNQYFENDPLIVKELRAFAREAKWTEEGDTATGAVGTIPARKIFLKKIGERWFLENKQQ